MSSIGTPLPGKYCFSLIFHGLFVVYFEKLSSKPSPTTMLIWEVIQENLKLGIQSKAIDNVFGGYHELLVPFVWYQLDTVRPYEWSVNFKHL